MTTISTIQATMNDLRRKIVKYGPDSVTDEELKENIKALHDLRLGANADKETKPKKKSAAAKKKEENDDFLKGLL